jgi:thiol-disulfide isomerase/thioredoxin
MAVSAFAVDGHKITFQIDGYAEQELYLAYHYNGKQFISDTMQIQSDGTFVVEGDETLDGGIYLVVLSPDNNYFEILVDTDDQEFKVKTSKEDLAGKLRFEGSKANDIFVEYSSYLRSKGLEAQQLQEAKQASGAEVDDINSKLAKLDKEVKAFQQSIIDKYPKSLTAAIIKATLNKEMPEFTGDEAAIKQKQYDFYKQHYFDYLDLSDARLLRTPMLHKKVMSYMDNLVFKVPDSLNMEIDRIIERASKSTETEQYWITNLLNKYAKESSEYVGMDAVYVHIAQEYYCNDKTRTQWIEEEQRDKICKNANELAPILIGNTAPNVRFQKPDNHWIELHDVKADFTVLYFWDPDCSHCKKSIPKAVEFFNNYADKGVKMVGVCNRRKEEKQMCWDAIEERDMKNWINVTDPFMQGKSKYNVKSNPRIFVLDKDKKIISKGIGSDQLQEVLDFHLKKLEEENTQSK